MNWLACVPNEDGRSLEVLYMGSDRAVCRAKVEKALRAGKVKTVSVYRYKLAARLSSASLVASLPRKSF